MKCVCSVYMGVSVCVYVGVYGCECVSVYELAIVYVPYNSDVILDCTFVSTGICLLFARTDSVQLHQHYKVCV
jgi:hypothetical protein